MGKDRVKAAPSKDSAADNRTLFLAKCPDSTSLQHLEAHYAPLGPEAIESVRWGHRRDGGFAGFMHVVFRSVPLAHQALEMPPPVVFGRTVKVTAVVDPTVAEEQMKQKSEAKKNDTSGGHRAAAKPKPQAPRTESVKDLSHKIHYADHKPSKILRFRRRSEIEVPDDCPVPVLAFPEVEFGPEIDQHLEQTFAKPTAVQSQAWPVLLGGRDCVALSKTGSGKTLAYLLPGLLHVRAQAHPEPTMLVLAPTRELTFQIASEAEPYALALKLRLGLAFGGMDGAGDRMMQSRVLRHGVDVVVGTPTRVQQFVEADVLNLKEVSYLALDEADQMLDAGFGPQIQAVVAGLRADRQGCMFSATWAGPIETLANTILTDPLKIVVNHADKLSVNPDVEQLVWVFKEEAERVKLCLQAVKQIKTANPESSRTVVFINAKDQVDDLVDQLAVLWDNVYALHGDYLQSERDASLRAVRADPHALLVATDIAARGLDVDLAGVVNYHMPTALDKYVHRLGRTGRAGRKGVAISLFHKRSNRHLAVELAALIQEAGQEPPAALCRLLPPDDSTAAAGAPQ